MGRIIILGGSSFLGRRLIQDFIELKINVIATSRKPIQDSVSSSDFLTWHLCDPQNQTALEELIKTGDTIINLIYAGVSDIDSAIINNLIEIDKKVNQITDKLQNSQNDNGEYLLSAKKVGKLKEELSKLKRRRYRIEAGIDRKELNDSIYASSNDDVQVQEIHLVKDQPYTFIFRSRDVIHCPWFPHFRAQINAVPGMETNFKLTPTITTLEMRAKPDVIEHWKNINVIHNERKRRIGEQEEEVLFDYILMCNKICGAGHSNMQLKVIVETQDEFDKWIQNNGDKKRLTISGEEVDWSTTKSKASL